MVTKKFKDATKSSKSTSQRKQDEVKVKELVSSLEHVIAAPANARAVMMKAMDIGSLDEPHRDHHAYSLGADLHFCGLATGDSLPLMGLFSLGPKMLAALLLTAAADHPNVYVGRLWLVLIEANRFDLEKRGLFVRWQRGWARYKIDCDSWGRFQANGDDGGWRTLPMTKPQRYLVQDVAVMLRLKLPMEMDRGTAHDWLLTNGAKMSYKGLFDQKIKEV